MTYSLIRLKATNNKKTPPKGGQGGVCAAVRRLAAEIRALVLRITVWRNLQITLSLGEP